MKTKVPLFILLFLLGFLSIGAIFGGGALILSPDGKFLKMPVSFLEASPFNNFFIPGMILFIILGIIPAILVSALIKKPAWPFLERINFFKDMYWAWSICIYIAFALIIWIQMEMFYIQSVHWLHNFYMFYAIAMILITLLPGLRSYYKKDNVD
jgi:magnesium-transporting ATPase (P-type)